MSKVQPMEIENNYYSYRDKKRTEDVFPILYLDNGLTIYSNGDKRFLYDNKKDTEEISQQQMENSMKNFREDTELREKTEAEKDIEKLESIFVDFETKNNKTKVTLMANPSNPKLPNLNNNEIDSLIGIGNSDNGCPDIVTPKCLLGFSLKTDIEYCPYTICNEKVLLNIVLDAVLVIVFISIVYLLYKLMVKK